MHVSWQGASTLSCSTEYGSSTSDQAIELCPPDTKLNDVEAQNILYWMGMELGMQPSKHSKCVLNLLIPSPESYTCADKARCNLEAPIIPAQAS